jgi:large subunit ribosomal protein L3
MRMAGQTGADRVTTRNLKVLKVDTDNHLLIVEGSVPGGPGGHLVIRKAVAAKPEPKPQVEKAAKGKVAAKPKK